MDSVKKTGITILFVVFLLCQLIPTYTFYEIDIELNNFKTVEIKKSVIQDINYIRYKPGNSYSKYLEIVLDDNKSFPFITENYEDRNKISIGDSIQKNKNNSELIFNDKEIFILKDLTNEKIFQRLFMLLIPLILACGMSFNKKSD